MHLGFIMDGNRRWAKEKGWFKSIGHKHGFDNLKNIIDLCLKEGIEYTSFWTLAKNNIQNREQEELDFIYNLIIKDVYGLKDDFLKKSISFRTVGDLSLLPINVKNTLEKLTEETKNGEKLTIIMAIGYGGQDEIVRGIKKFIIENAENIKSDLEEALVSLDEGSFFKYLDTGDFPAPDLIVRTGGDIRMSGYFLYASEYSEYHFTKTYWPDFGEKDFYEALDLLKGAKRNFGK
ncbi:MAG: polyprenyl diphosphate synthase [Candidatus Gracilibacteria bacterium]|nr:polyprenyl diphosphate synthase [Candidatus Gracilibacteria bacterium]MDD3119928.1 polyprenyl diphosphate synthase [Candidatus Gracilibacteria bacterium]MDD4530930.1 polyprenyl diphosphate synthase [Candidatus Gracilibacteria bacterium]